MLLGVGSNGDSNENTSRRDSNFKIMKRTMDKYNKRLIEGFTLTEIMIVVVLIGIIAAFGIPSFDRMIRKAHERNAILGLTSINQGNVVYSAKSLNGQYLPGTDLTLPAINTGLSIDIKGLDLTYDYDRTAPGAYTATAAWAGANPFTVIVDEGPIVLGTNPSCLVGPCPTL